MTQRTPVEVFAPGEFIDEELEARGWSQVELAEVLGRPPRLISELVSGKRAITPETAKGLGAAFGTGPEFWMNLERDYRLSRAMHDDDGVERRAKLYTKAPVKEMCKRGWIEPSENVEVLEKRVHDFFQLSNIDDAPCLAHATSSQWAWLCRIQQLAQAMSVPKYSKRTLIEALGKMEALLAAPEEAGRVPGILAECGVRFVVVEKLPQAEIDGA